MQLGNFFSLAFVAAATAQTLQQVLNQNNATLSTLNTLLNRNPQLAATLSRARGITILAPTDEAFNKLVAENPATLQMASNPALVTALLSYHVLSGMFPSSAFTAAPQIVATLMNAPPFANVTGGQKVELLASSNRPTIISGFKRQSLVTGPNVPFDGGLIHVIDTVLTLPVKPSQVALDTGLTSLVGALTRASLVGGLDGAKDVTVFAPNNQAFQAIGSAVLTMQPQELSQVLTYHVIQGRVLFASTLPANGQPMSFRTVNGGAVTLRREGGQVFVNSARVVVSDVISGNGVVHVIDNVLNPAASTLTPNPTQTTQPVAFSGATGIGDTPFTSGITPTTTINPLGATGAAQPRGIPSRVLLSLLGGAALLANL